MVIVSTMRLNTCSNLSTPSKSEIHRQLLSNSGLTEAYGRLYKNLGETYHKLPVVARKHPVISPVWQEYCKLAFVRTESRELPDMIQLMYMLQQHNSIVSVALFHNELAKAWQYLASTGWLLLEAADRLEKLSIAMKQYARIAKAVMALVGALPLHGLMAKQYVKWCDALPECVREYGGESEAESEWSDCWCFWPDTELCGGSVESVKGKAVLGLWPGVWSY